MVIPVLLKKLNTTITRTGNNLAEHPFFSGARSNENIDNLIKLYVEGHSHFWKSSEVLDWLRKNVNQVFDMVQCNDSFITALEPLRQQYLQVLTRSNIFQFLHFSEYSEIVPTLPADLMLGQPVHARQEMNEEDFFLMDARGAGTNVVAPTNNPLGLFLWSLLPWNPTPNRPPNADPNHDNAQQRNLLDMLMQMWHSSSEEDHPHQVDNEDDLD